MEQQLSSFSAATAGKPAAAEIERKSDYAAIRMLPTGKPRLSVEQRGPTVLLYPNTGSTYAYFGSYVLI